MSLSPEDRLRFTPIIDSILARSDLNTISEKRIRKGLQEEIGYDLTPQKAAVKQLIMERFDIFAAKGNSVAAPEPAVTAATTTNGHSRDHGSETPPAEPSSPTQSSVSHKRQADSEDGSDISSKTPPAKKKKPDNDIDADALFAAKLQAEENMRVRQTRGGSTRRAPPVKKNKAKTSKKVKAEDDSDLDSGSESGKKVNRSGGFHKPLTLSPALSALLGGEVTLSRPQTVKRLWQYIHEHDLQDPSDRRQICCDDAMRAVFKQDRIHMFTMTKILSQNLYSPDE
ncbi:SWIB/MDM2 domain protein [Aspergillus saccharolyticus JOP 1030-1]|uniref:SWIB-domain-containing protein n=1 Tax=Aspergillus saccharolyticus JOP 1030-1 TaxID=1450539 RepID=A0A319A087_9EURO|nr:SWIB-domain-containing protein [Aspergillus saccharolyticus JOP 1030-1]PYH49920.1 SWIB-domain-containing protein [Aspergillus saccharolyticus JOP 1030-1]